MRIAILDGFTLNPGDLSWDRFHSLGECVIYDRTTPEEIVPRSSGYDILLVNKTQITRAVIEQLPDLKYIGVLATGFNIVDTSAAAERDIPVTNIPEYGTYSVAQMVFAHILHFCHHAAEHSDSVHQGKWSGSLDWCYWDYPLVELTGLTMGIVGLGRIGSAVANLAQAFGMNVIAHDPGINTPTREGITIVGLDAVFQNSDFVSLHCPLTPQNQGFVNKKLIGQMKPGAFLINTSRGGLIDESALAEALNSGRIAGAGLDVLSNEPPDSSNPLLTSKNCVITPHIAWATRSARLRLMNTAFENVESFMRGNCNNVVNEVNR